MRNPLRPLLASLFLASALLAQEPAAPDFRRFDSPGQVFVAFETDDVPVDLAPHLAAWDLPALAPDLRLDGARPLLQWRRRGSTVTTNVVLLDYGPEELAPREVQRLLEGVPGIAWAHPNVAVEGDVKELIPNDPQFGAQWHHPVMQNAAAWDVTLGSANIVIGVADDGVDTGHEDLAANIWVNQGEIPLDSVDNDGNGFVDDVNGFDFVTEDNNPNPNGSGDDHGTHVAGIAAARTNNGTGVAGVAGNSTIMPLQFYVPGQSWVASDIVEAFGYAADNGAHIVNTSYNMDVWVGDPVVLAAFEYLYDNGVLHINSSGNGGALNPPRQDYFQTTLFVANTGFEDVVSSSSNYGTGVDIAAPGSSVLSTELGNTYGAKSGTSMAAPNACGVAALIWALNPGWSRDQVAAQLVATADNIDGSNPGYEGLLGGGRVNAFRAVTEALPAPRVVSSTGLPAEGGSTIGLLGNARLRFDQILDPAAVNNPAAFVLEYAGPDGIFGSGDESSLPVSAEEYLISTNEIQLTLPDPLPSAGEYRFVADASILQNPFGTAVDGDGDGAGGDSWVRHFTSCAAFVVLVDNAESGADYSVVNENLGTGAWEVPPVVPTGGGVRNDPPTDFDGSGKCFVTQDGPGDQDVDGGPTRLISRAFDLSGIVDPYLSYARWLVDSSNTDVLEVDISNNNGNSWVPVETVGTLSGWDVATLRVSDHVLPSAQTRLRFSVEDATPFSITEAGIDFLRVVSIDCVIGDSVGTSYCVGAPNSVGAGASIRAEGSDVLAVNDLELMTEGLPAGVNGIYFFGGSAIQAPFGDGFLCVGGTLTRLPPAQASGAGGVARRVVDLSAPPVAGLVSPGVTTRFQYWYRDTAAGNTGFNTSDGLAVTWQ